MLVIRRSLRIGIRLGMLAGLVFALFKIIEARRPLPPLPGDDPWAPTHPPDPAAGPAPAPARPAPADDAPALVEPTMLQSTSLRRPATGADDRAFDAASTAPPVVSPADPFAPPAVATPSPSPPVAAEIQPDDDEIVILSTGGPEPTPTAAPVSERPTQVSPEKAAVKKAPAKKAPAKKAGAKKAGAKKAAPAAGKKAASKKAVTAAWVEPDGGVCPTTHPVKAKLRSAIFHLPGMAAYARTSPDRCYRDEAAALGDGLRKAAR
ncbi:MAG TPA: hypothetical protein VHS52_00375 [Acidimicrobiales bacterium]|nr:hypothetical protein [Acidimicrobiales bacterium]